MNQPEFDFEKAEAERPLMEHYARLEALAAASGEFSEESLCLAWLTESDGRAWRDWWTQLPSYKRNGMLEDYRFERDRANRCGRSMHSYAYIIGSRKEHLDAEDAAANQWAVEIKQAAAERRPVPFRESEEMNGFERLAFRTRLSRAFQIAGVVIIEAATPEPEKKGRRRAT
jgi:hypothetical protein